MTDEEKKILRKELNKLDKYSSCVFAAIDVDSNVTVISVGRNNQQALINTMFNSLKQYNPTK